MTFASIIERLAGPLALVCAVAVFVAAALEPDLETPAASASIAAPGALR